MSAENMTKDCKPVLSIQVDEIMRGSEKDYRIQARIHHGGLSLEFSKTVEEIRDFFTRRRIRSEQRLLPEGKGKLKTV
jgi:hypothetical protein